MFDDNVAPGVGDNFSIKIACAVLLNLPSIRGVAIANSMNHGRVPMEEAINKSRTIYHDMIKTYMEFPSIWNSPGPSPRNQNYIFNVSGIDGALKSYKLKNRPTKYGQMYFNICYVELNENDSNVQGC